MTTKHNHAPRFGQKFDGCPRCDELKAGAAPVQWFHSGIWDAARKRYLTAAEASAKRSEEIRNHNCKTSRCGVVCTAFQW